MCNFWSGLLLRSGKVAWSPKTSSHSELIKENNLDDEIPIEDISALEFVPFEVTPKDLVFHAKERDYWELAINLKELPAWFTSQRVKMECLIWNEWEKAMSETLWKLRLENIPKVVEEIKQIKYFSQKGKIKPSWHVSYGKTWDAARGAAGIAAGNAARIAAWNAARDAAGIAAGNAAGIAAGIAAGDAAGIAAGNAAGIAAGNAAWDATLYCRIMILTEDSRVAKEHIKHADDRMEVWRGGYGLYGDVNGKLYVYAIKPKNKGA